tara:strand:+ start:348 stop:527 length:180 start_codon:yes stop_codon:yes gene_type:complete
MKLFLNTTDLKNPTIEITYDDFKNECKYCGVKIYQKGYCDSHCRRYDEEKTVAIKEIKK